MTSTALRSASPGCTCRFSTLRLTLRPVIARTISPASVLAVRRFATVRPSRRIVTRSVIAVTSWSLCVTNSTVRPSEARRFQHGEQRVALQRRQDGGRLVEDKDARVAIERLQNLDALAHTDGQFTHRGVRVDRQAMALGQLRDLSPRRAAVDEQARASALRRRLCSPTRSERQRA